MDVWTSPCFICQPWFVCCKCNWLTSLQRAERMNKECSSLLLPYLCCQSSCCSRGFLMKYIRSINARFISKSRKVVKDWGIWITIWALCADLHRGSCSPLCCLTGIRGVEQMQIASGQCNTLLMECRSLWDKPVTSLTHSLTHWPADNPGGVKLCACACARACVCVCVSHNSTQYSLRPCGVIRFKEQIKCKMMEHLSPVEPLAHSSKSSTTHLHAHVL